MSGMFRDPFVGRDVVVGIVAGAFTVCIMWFGYAEATWLNLNAASPLRPALESFRDLRHFAALIIFLHAVTLATGVCGLFALAVFDRLLVARWLAVTVWAAIFLAVSWPSLVSGGDWRIALQTGLARAAIAAAVLSRFGPLALAAMLFTTEMLTRSPAALEFSAWYSNRSLIALAIVLAVGLHAARTAVRITPDAPMSPAR